MEFGAVVADLGGAGAGDDGDALVLEDLGQQRARLGLLQRHEPRGCLDNRHRDTEAREHLRQLGTDCAATEHDQRGRQCLHLDRLMIRPVRRVGEAGDRWYCRGRAGGDDDAASSAVLHPADFDDVAGDEPTLPSYERAALAHESVDRDGVVPVVGCLGTDARRHRRPVGLHSCVPGNAGNSARLGEEVSGADHHLRRHAAPIRALATDESRVDSNDAEPGLGEFAGDLLTPWPHADDNYIDVDRRAGGFVSVWILRFGHATANTTSVPAFPGCQRVSWMFTRAR